jgi:hypothetical protein
MILRNPPALPPPSLATRCLNTPPRSASVIVAGYHILGGFEQHGISQSRLSGKPGKFLRNVNAQSRRSPNMKDV